MSITIHPLEVSKPWYNKYKNNSDTSNDGSGSGSGTEDNVTKYYKFNDYVNATDMMQGPAIMNMLGSNCFTLKIIHRWKEDDGYDSIQIIDSNLPYTTSITYSKYLAFSFTPNLTIYNGTIYKPKNVEDLSTKNSGFIYYDKCTNFVEITEEEYFDLTSDNGVLYE